MSYLLATTENRVRWYRHSEESRDGVEPFTLSEVLDLRKSPVFPNKDAARAAAIALGLKTWRYVKI